MKRPSKKSVALVLALCICVPMLTACMGLFGMASEIVEDAVAGSATRLEDILREAGEGRESVWSTEDWDGSPPAIEGVSAQPSEDAQWAVYIYLCGTDLETEDGSATDNLAELMEVPFDGDLNVFVLTGGTQQWHTPGIPTDKLAYYYVSQEGLTLLEERELASMGEAETLQDFLDWGTEAYPAEKEGVIIWNHGSGPVLGAAFDELFEEDGLNPVEMRDAFAATGEQFEFIGFDACMMGSLEVASTLAPYANYMIASEEIEPGGGWDYAAWASFLNENPDATGAQLGEVVCDSYYRKCEADDSAEIATMACIEMESVEAVADAFDDVALQLEYGVGEERFFSTVTREVGRTEAYGGFSPQEGYSNQIDLGHFLDNISGLLPQESASVTSALDEAVVYQVSGSARKYASGLSIFYPQWVVQEEYDAYYDYGEEIFSGAYGEYIDTVLEMQAEAGLIYEEEGSPVEVVEEADVDDYGMLHMTLDPDSMWDYVDSVEFSLYQLEGDEITYLGSDNDVYIDWDTGYIEDNFYGYWPTINGHYVAFYIVEETDEYIIYSAPVVLNGSETNLRLVWTWDDPYSEDNYSGEFRVVGAWDGIDPVTGKASREIRKIRDGDVIAPIYSVYDMDFNEETVYGDEFVVEGRLRMEYEELAAGEYLYCFDIMDIYGNWTFSDFALMTIGQNGDVYVELY